MHATHSEGVIGAHILVMLDFIRLKFLLAFEIESLVQIEDLPL
jgi:hypothetical protein